MAIPGDNVPPLERTILSQGERLRTGNYEYICIGTDGNSWSLASGEATTDCHGSFLHKYINGSLVAIYHLAYGGGAVSTWTWTSGCIIGVSTSVAALVLGPTGLTEWLVWAAATGAGLASCVA